MSDRRLTPANGRVAAAFLRGQVEAEAFVEGAAARVIAGVADLCPAPSARRERQVIFGDVVTVYERLGGWAFVQAAKDGYVGYIADGALGAPSAPTHFVATLGTHLYEGESFKSRDLLALTLGSCVTVTAEGHKMWETPEGYIPKKHLRPLDKPFTDPATVAQAFFGVPYLWGGNSRAGIDCSGVVQAALLACAIPCPGDSDLQQAGLGEAIPDGVPPERGDIYFWKGHVGMLVDPATMIHANAHHMACVYEPIADAIIRIEAQGDGKVTARRRL